MCPTHRKVVAGLHDLRDRGVIDGKTLAIASQAAANECEYVIAEKDPNGSCVLRHP